MQNNWTRALGDLDEFIRDIPPLTEDFMRRVQIEENTLKAIRRFALEGEGGSSGDPRIMREMMAAFAAFVNAYYGYRIKKSWWFGWKLIATNGRDRCEFFDFFYRAVFEELDMAPEDEGLGTPGGVSLF